MVSGGVRSMVGLNDLGGLFQTKQFYDSTCSSDKAGAGALGKADDKEEMLGLDSSYLLLDIQNSNACCTLII